MARLTDNSYGKATVRLTKVKRLAKHHELVEAAVDVQLRGSFEESYLTGDNRKIVATDSIKNTVYVIAANHPIDSIEQYALSLADHFLKKYSHVDAATITVTQDLWNRVGDGKHPHAFVSAGSEKRQCIANVSRKNRSIESAIVDLEVLKTTDSAWKDFLRDEFTTLADTDDRIMASQVKANWAYRSAEVDFNRNYSAIRKAIIDTFAAHKSLGVQQTEFAMGEAALNACKDIDQITITMPNRHRVPFNLKPFGLENKNEIFVTTSEPAGLISATVSRD